MFNKYLKRFIYFGITVAFVIAGAWVAGTFNPNDYTVQKIEDEFHKKEMRIIEELGLKEPEFEFSDKVSFINATSTCVSYLNWTTDKDKRVPISIIIAILLINESNLSQTTLTIKGHCNFPDYGCASICW